MNQGRKGKESVEKRVTEAGGEGARLESEERADATEDGADRAEDVADQGNHQDEDTADQRLE